MILYTVRTHGIHLPRDTWKMDDTMMMMMNNNNNNVVHALHCTLPHKAMALHVYAGLYGVSKVVASGRSAEPKSKLFLWIRRDNRKLLRDGCPSHFFSLLSLAIHLFFCSAVCLLSLPAVCQLGLELGS